MADQDMSASSQVSGVTIIIGHGLFGSHLAPMEGYGANDDDLLRQIYFMSALQEKLKRKDVFSYLSPPGR